MPSFVALQMCTMREVLYTRFTKMSTHLSSIVSAKSRDKRKSRPNGHCPPGGTNIIHRKKIGENPSNNCPITDPARPYTCKRWDICNVVSNVNNVPFYALDATLLKTFLKLDMNDLCISSSEKDSTQNSFSSMSSVIPSFIDFVMYIM